MAPIRPVLRNAGVTEQQWRVLRVLSGGPCEPSRAAESALLHPPSVTRILKELIDRGFILREPNPSDGRRAVLTLAPAGRKLIRETSAHTIKLVEGYKQAFGVERFDALLVELVALTEAIRPLGLGAAPEDE